MSRLKDLGKNMGRALFGLILLFYSVWLVGGFFISDLNEISRALASRYKIVDFLLVNVVGTPHLVLIGLCLGGIYFLASINILLFKDKSRAAAAHLLFSIWIFLILSAAFYLKAAMTTGFSGSGFSAQLEDAFAILRLALPAIIFLPFLGGEKSGSEEEDARPTIFPSKNP